MSRDTSVLTATIPPLIPSELLDEYKDFINPELREVVQANCLRRYLEGAINLLLKNKVLKLANITEGEWEKNSLDEKINLIKKHVDKSISYKFFKIKNIGNKGAHFGQIVTSDEIKRAIDYALNIFEDLLVIYFKENKIGTQPPVLTLLSSLPPIKRVYILEKVWEHDKGNLWIVDKLSMAYLKSGDFQKSLDFLESIKGDLGETAYEEFKWKIECLKKNLNRFDISKNVEDVIRIFNLLTKDEYYEKYPEFTNMFCVLVSGYNYK